MSFLISSSHRDLGLPAGLHVRGFHLYIFFTTLVSGILFMCPKQNLTNIYDVLTKFNSLTPNLNFMIEEERNNSINFLDITITKTDNHMSYKVYRKPTTTDSIIPNDSCHPVQHKLAAIRFLTNRHDTYHLDNENKQNLK
jgi:hypothetical protein